MGEPSSVNRVTFSSLFLNVPELLLALSDAEKDLGVEQCEDDERDHTRGQQPRPHPVVLQGRSTTCDFLSS